VAAFTLLLPSFSLLISTTAGAQAAEGAQYATKGAIVYQGKTFLTDNKTYIYGLAGAQKCSTGSTDYPYEYIDTAQAGNITYERIDLTKKDSTGRLTCERLPSVKITLTGNPNMLFYQQGDSVFDYTKRFEFKKLPSAGGGATMYVKADQAGNACPDAIANVGGKWLFFPMTTLADANANEVRHGQLAISETYATYMNNPGYRDGCRVASLKIRNVYNLANWQGGTVTTDDDDYDDCQQKTPAIVEWNKLPNLTDEADFEADPSYNWGWNNKDYVEKCGDTDSNATYYFARVENNIIVYNDGFTQQGDDAYVIVNGVSSIAPSANPGAPESPLLPGQDANANDTKTTCVIPGIGWILCPVLDISSKLADGIYAFVAAFLTFQPLVNDPTNGIFKAWSTMRNFANVAFVIAFLLIIFSQVTSIGITNYGIKRMLPRLIAAAILVNISFWVCAIAVDLSNIGGTSIKALFDTAANSLNLPATGADGWAVGNQWQGITATVIGTLAVGIALYVSLAALIPLLGTSLIFLIILFVALILRQALIVLLIVASPIAFVAFLLPNTEGLFNRWRTMFITLLMMYPIAGLIFGASALAGEILARS
jgi:hypothetical protein